MGQTNENENPELILEKLKSLTIKDESNTSLDESFHNIRNILNEYIFYKDILEKNNNSSKTLDFFQRFKFSSSYEYSKKEIKNVEGNYDKNSIKDIKHKIERIKKWVKMAKFPFLYKYEKNCSINDTFNNKEKNKNEKSINKDNNNEDDIYKINNEKTILSNYTDKKIENGLSEFCKNQNSKFLERLKKGPPDCFRWPSWCVINNLTLERDNLIYENYTNMTLEKENKDRILRDIERTFSDKNIEKKKLRKMETSLYKVLKAFWNLDKEIGYCQGMNLLVGFLLILADFNERDTFFLLISIFSDTFKIRKKYEYSFRGLFCEEFPFLYFLNSVFELLLEQYIPDLKNHLDNLGITIDLWMGKWFQTAFTIILPINWCKRLWDNIFAENIFFMAKFGIAFAMLIKDDIMKMNEEVDILDYFKEFEKYSLCIENAILNGKSDVYSIILKSKKIKIDIEDFINNYEKNNEIGKDFVIKMEKIENIRYEFYEQIVSKPSVQTILFSEEENEVANNSIINKNDNLKKNEIFKDNIMKNKNAIIKIEREEMIGNIIDNKDSFRNNILSKKNTIKKGDEKQKYLDYNNEKININTGIPDILIINKKKENNNNIIKITEDSIDESYYQNVSESINFERNINIIIKNNIETHHFIKYLNNNKLEDITLKAKIKNDEYSLSQSQKGKNETIGIHLPKEGDISSFIGKNKFQKKKQFIDLKNNNRDNNSLLKNFGIIFDKEKVTQCC